MEIRIKNGVIKSGNLKQLKKISSLEFKFEN